MILFPMPLRESVYSLCTREAKISRICINLNCVPFISLILKKLQTCVNNLQININAISISYADY